MSRPAPHDVQRPPARLTRRRTRRRHQSRRAPRPSRNRSCEARPARRRVTTTATRGSQPASAGDLRHRPNRKCAISFPLHQNELSTPNIDGLSTTPSRLHNRAASRFRKASVTNPACLRRDTRRMTRPDAELESFSREELIEEVIRLRRGIRDHRDSTEHNLCWHHPQLWGLLPESADPVPTVPEWPQFLRGCVAYRQSLDDQLPTAPRTSDEYDAR
jgi:hypothetical protein